MTKLDSEKRAQIAERLKEARKLAGLSQGHVAKMLVLHRPSVSEMEAGNRRVSADEVARLAEIYDVSVAWLLGEAPETLDAQDPRVELAARELSKLKPDDLGDSLGTRRDRGRQQRGGGFLRAGAASGSTGRRAFWWTEHLRHSYHIRRHSRPLSRLLPANKPVAWR